MDSQADPLCTPTRLMNGPQSAVGDGRFNMKAWLVTALWMPQTKAGRLLLAWKGGRFLNARVMLDKRLPYVVARPCLHRGA